MDHHPALFYFLSGFPVLLNTQAATILVFLLIVLIVISFCLSGAQVAFFSLTYKDINMLKTKQQAGYKRIVDLLEEPKTLRASMLIGNMFINLGIIIISSMLIDALFPLNNQLWWVAFLIKVLIVTFILVLFGEIMPKVMATQNNIRFAKEVGPLVQGMDYFFKGLGKRFVDLSDLIEKGLVRKNGNIYNIEQLDTAVETTSNNETLTKEKNILKGVVKFGNITVKQIMKSRLDVSGVAHDTPFTEVVKRIEELHYSRLPVFKEDLDEVVGMINTKDLLPYLGQQHDFDWHIVMRPPYFVHEQKMIEDLLREFQSKRIHFAVVVDEFGGTSGIVTLEDIMEEIIGDINDEFDEIDVPYTKLDDKNFIFEGKTMISDVCRVLNINEDTFDGVKGESESLGGLVMELAGEIPGKEELIISVAFEFRVMELEKNRLQKIKVSINSL